MPILGKARCCTKPSYATFKVLSGGVVASGDRERIASQQGHSSDTIGATDPAEAADGTIRKLYAESKGRNAVHGSDSDENAEVEIAFFFSGLKLVG